MTRIKRIGPARPTHAIGNSNISHRGTEAQRQSIVLLCASVSLCVSFCQQVPHGPRGFAWSGEPVAEQAALAAEQEETAAVEEPVAAESDEVIIHDVNNMNKGASEKSDVSHDAPCTCAAEAAEEKNSRALFSKRQRPEAGADPLPDPRLEPANAWDESGGVESPTAAPTWG